jgi:hypothetical protein
MGDLLRRGKDASSGNMQKLLQQECYCCTVVKAHRVPGRDDFGRGGVSAYVRGVNSISLGIFTATTLVFLNRTTEVEAAVESPSKLPVHPAVGPFITALELSSSSGIGHTSVR